MRTVGIDVASSDANTATCWIRWEAGKAWVEPNGLKAVNDAEVSRCVAEADRVGIDIPLGWPTDFVNAVGRHHRGEAWEPADMARLRLRATDRWVTDRARRPGQPEARCHPMSVSTNLIGVPALRFARVLGSIDRSGAGRVVEVYPAAALFVWGLSYQGYKGSEATRRAVRDKPIRDLRATVPLDADNTVWERCQRSDHALDALIASLVARAKACGLCDEAYDARSEAARAEGWIALPSPNSLALLADGAAASSRHGSIT